MDEILTIPAERRQQRQGLLCALMGVTLLMMLSLANLQAAHRAAHTPQAMTLTR